MDITNSLQSTGVVAGQYVPEKDVVATLDDGRTIQLAVKGTPIPLSVAFQHGLVDETGKPVKQSAAGPSETKETPKKSDAGTGSGAGSGKTAEGSAPSQGGAADTATTTDNTPPADETK